MRAMQIARDIVPLGQFKSHASRLLRQLRADARPLVITQNGRPAAVLLTPEEFDRLVLRDRFLAALGEGVADSEAGRVVADEDLAQAKGTVSK